MKKEQCPRCHDSGVLHPERDVYEWCDCVLGTLQRELIAKRRTGAPWRFTIDFDEFYRQREIPFFKRNNHWQPSEW